MKNGEHSSIHRGISQRQFARSFTKAKLADDVKVNGADYLKQMVFLTISCERILPKT